MGIDREVCPSAFNPLSIERNVTSQVYIHIRLLTVNEGKFDPLKSVLIIQCK